MTLLLTEHSDRDFRAYGGPHVVEYAVMDRAKDELIPLVSATWADWDQRGRLVVAKEGRLHHWELPRTLHEIANFNPHEPVPEPAPDRASVWPRH